jgi:16S rRNA A1518/A1519 N6-dimethyltransferase RsmA/KsgA/DIM1 with predicted DNA glycosylase/AP lyase activity
VSANKDVSDVRDKILLETKKKVVERLIPQPNTIKMGPLAVSTTTTVLETIGKQLPPSASSLLVESLDNIKHMISELDRRLTQHLTSINNDNNKNSNIDTVVK